MKRIILSMIMLVCWSGTAAALKTGEIRKGNRLYHEGNYESAIQHYEQALKKDEESALANFNAGTAYYKHGQYDQAINHLQKSLLTDDQELQGKTHYNLGNSFLKSGLAKEKDDINSAISQLEKSLAQYEGALKIAPKDEDAKYNDEIAKKELARLKQEKKSPDQKKQENQKNQPKKDQQSDQNKQENQKNQQDQKNQQNPERPGDQNKKDQPENQGGPKQDQQNQSKPEDQSEPGQQQQQSPQPESGQENKEKTSPGSAGNDNIESSQPDAQGTASPGDPGEEKVPAGAISKKNAEQLLNHYQQSEEPQGLLNMMKNKHREEPVLKDW